MSDSRSKSNNDSENIPPVTEELEEEPVPSDTDVQFIVAAIATTGLDVYTDELCQLALLQEVGGKQTFSCEYILPKKQFPPRVTEYNGFSVLLVKDKRVLTNSAYSSRPLNTRPAKKVLKTFGNKVREIASRPGKRTVLVVYKAQFDLSIIFRTMEENGISPRFLQRLNIKVLDALELVKSVRYTQLPDIENIKQRTVYRYLYQDPEDEQHKHETFRDMRTLHAIMFGPKRLEFAPTTLLKSSVDIKSEYQKYKKNKKIYTCFQSLKKGGLVVKKVNKKEGVISENAGRKLAEKRLSYRKLVLIFKKCKRKPQKQAELLRNWGLSKATGKKIMQHFLNSTKLN